MLAYLPAGACDFLPWIFRLSGPRVESVRAEVTLDMKLYSTLLSYSTLTKHKKLQASAWGVPGHPP